MGLALPFVWVGAELIRGLLLTGFPWFLLAHSVYRFLSLIQISDLTGAYGVSFVIAALNGAVADAWMRYRAISKTENTKPKTERQRRAPSFVGFRLSIFGFRFSTVWALGLLVVALVYGQVQLQRHTQSAGPRVAILQGDYPNYVDSDASHPRPEDVAQFYFALMQQAQAARPDLYLLPESPWFMFLNREFLTHDPASLPTIWRVYQNTFQMYWDEFSTWAQQNGAYVVTGAASLHFDPYDLLDKERKYNSAFIFAPDGQPPRRYDKVHVVPFGETIPFRFGRLRFLYLAINDISPFGQNGYEYSMWPGARFDTFSMRSASQDQRTYRFAVPICYEDVMPYVARRFTAGGGSAGASQATGKHIDFLLNISNDGWFLHSSELVQHLAIGAFRAVENRVGIARAVNTGVSAFIDANGRIDHTISVGTTGFRVAPVMVDSRFSIYSRIGDAFAWTCVIVLAALYLDYTVARIRGRPTALSVEP
jgi:apolipoprotein N-acyltransferase